MSHKNNINIITLKKTRHRHSWRYKESWFLIITHSSSLNNHKDSHLITAKASLTVIENFVSQTLTSPFLQKNHKKDDRINQIRIISNKSINSNQSQ